MKQLLFFLGIVFSTLHASSQDLNARVELLYPKLQNVNRTTFNLLEKTIKDFLNTRKWTDDILQPQERIDCSFVITITEWDGINFKAEAQIQSSRPVYGATYNTTILNLVDKDFSFTYVEGQDLEFSEQNFTSNLSSLLAFYAFTIMGLDYDTFSKFGGTSIYYRAQNVLNSASSAANSKGWQANESFKNRYWLLENLLNSEYNPIRETLYTYHRLGLDNMSAKPAEGRKAILATLPQLQGIDGQKQGNRLSFLFISAKSDEIVGILSKAESQEKLRAYTILNQMDPSNSLKYEALTK